MTHLGIETTTVAKGARRKPLAACLASLLGLAAHDACAVVVTNCFDSGPGSLRDIVANHAASGDTVDLSGLSCPNSTISLTTGAIVINQDSLSLLGPGSGSLAIKGGNGSVAAPRDMTVLDHQGSGTLSVQGLELTGGFGHYSASSEFVMGGCLYSHHNVVLNDVLVDNCNADAFVNGSPTLAALGGGVFASNSLTMTHSVIRDNYVGAEPSGNVSSFGGGVFAFGNLTVKYSTISGNSAGYSTVLGQGGGADAQGSVSIEYSTIDYNRANVYDGGLAIVSAGTATITNSTISHNFAPSYGGLYSSVATTISNSTIAFNRKSAISGGSAGATFGPRYGSIAVTLHSTLIAHNTYAVAGVVHENDLATVKTSIGSTVTFPTDASQGNFNLVRAPDASVSGKLPADTLTGVCPLLGPLKANGGPTRTHALYSRSPAIDAGVNNLGLSYDQRWGPPPPPIAPPPDGFSRHSGTRTDIGAFEVQQEDIVFAAGFEGCP